MVPFAIGPIYWPENYQPVNPGTADGNWEDLTAFNDCLNHCSEENCKVGPRLPAVHTATGAPYAYPAGGIVAADCAGDVLVNAARRADILANKASITPADEDDLKRMIDCFRNCDGSPVACLGLPGGYPWPAGALDCTGWVEGNVWYDAIVANAMIAGGPSCDLSWDADFLITDGWLYSTEQSIREAKNQVAKFEKRRDFLYWRLKEAQNILSIFGEDTDGDGTTDTGIIEKLETFLRGPAADLIQARIDYAPPSGETGLPYQAIYGWRNEDEVLPSGGTRRGKWHIVKVEARVPGACDDRCSWSQTSRDPAWPRIRTYTKSWGTKRCYELVNTEGSVKFRTTRWDEDKSAKSCAGLSPCPVDCTDCGGSSVATYHPVMRFPNGEPIWSFKGNHPLRPLSTSLYNPDLLDGVCASSTLTELPGSMTPTTIYMGAFMLNRFNMDGGPENNEQCWNLAHGLLSSGVFNETCARYYWHGGTNTGMGIEFVECEEF